LKLLREIKKREAEIVELKERIVNIQNISLNEFAHAWHTHEGRPKGLYEWLIQNNHIRKYV